MTFGWIPCAILCLTTGVALAVPEVVDDQYDAAEDVVLNTLAGPVISADFDNNGGAVVPVFDGDWDYLDQMENQVGADHSYPGWGRPGVE